VEYRYDPKPFSAGTILGPKRGIHDDLYRYHSWMEIGKGMLLAPLENFCVYTIVC